MDPRPPRRRRPAAALGLAAILCACTASPLPSVSQPFPASPSPTIAPTPDLIAPTIAGRDPPPGGVIGAAGVSVTFTEPVHGVDAAAFQLATASGAVARARVALDPSGMTATLVPAEPLSFATAYTASLSGLVHDLAGNALARTEWDLLTSDVVTFGAGTYTGYQFGASAAHLTGLHRSQLAASSTATASEYRLIGDAGYLLITSGIWEGFWVHGLPDGQAQDDLTAPIQELPACDYVDLPAARVGYGDWGTTVLDTVFQLPAGYAPPDLVDTAKAGLNGGYYIRGVALDDLSAMIVAASAAGARLAVQSAYRSYTGQVLTFNGWVSQAGYAEALRVSARPGHSEHQLATAIDFKTVGGIAPWRYADWATSTEGAWLAANAWRFGWLMSYPKGSSAVSCYSYEPWHYRYVGRSTAAAVHAAGLTLRQWLWSQGYGIR